MAVAQEFPEIRPVPAWRQQLGAAWRWWIAEIAQLVPERFADLRGTAVPVVVLNGDEVALIEPRSAVSSETQLELGPLDDARRRAAMRALLERAGETRGRVRICLAPGEALVRRVGMPAATEENLRQVLAFEMDRLTPFRAEDVYFDYRVVGRDAAASQVTVQLAVARRELVDARVDRVRALGASVQGVTVRDEVANAIAPLDLLPSEQRGERESSRERVIQRSLAGLVVLLVLVALVLPLYIKRRAVVELLPVVAKARQEAEATDAVARELERQVADYNFLLAKKYATYPALAYIEEVSRLLPDNTWLQQLDLRTVGKNREVQIAGETASSSKLIEILEQSRMLQNAETRGTVTRGSQPGTERFLIAAQTRPRTLPEPISLVEMPVPIAPASAAPAQQVEPPAPPPTATVTPVVPAKRAGEAKPPLVDKTAPKN